MSAPVRDPALYRKLSEPHADADVFNAALVAFFAEVRESRIKHRIADVAVIASGHYLVGDEECQGVASSFNGNSSNQLSMVAHVFGRLQAEHAEQLALFVAGGKKQRK